MTKGRRTIGLGDLVVLAHIEAARLVHDPTVASLVAARVVRRVLATSGNRRAVRELSELARAS